MLGDLPRRELEMIDSAKTSKRYERVIEKFQMIKGYAPRAVIRKNHS